MDSKAFAQQRADMVRFQIKGRGVADKRVLSAMGQVPRHLFVPEALQSEAYADHPLPIGAEQTISQPYMVALMSESLALPVGAKVLEVGAGCGYQSAVLQAMGYQVRSIERIPQLVELANKNLRAAGFSPLVELGDGYLGLSESAQFDGALVAAAAPQVPPALLRQVSPGGVLVIPLGEVNQTLYRLSRTEKSYTKQRLCAVRFVPLVAP